MRPAASLGGNVEAPTGMFSSDNEGSEEEEEENSSGAL
jgi:hypothetical protein